MQYTRENTQSHREMDDEGTTENRFNEMELTQWMGLINPIWDGDDSSDGDDSKGRSCMCFFFFAPTYSV